MLSKGNLAVKAAHRLPSKWVMTILVVIMVCYLFMKSGLEIFELDQRLPKPIIDYTTANALNTYRLKSLYSSTSSLSTPIDTSGMSLTVVIRTYNKFVAQNSTLKLLHNLNDQSFHLNNAFPISAIVVSTDKESVNTLRSAVNSQWSKRSSLRNIDIHYHEVAPNVYSDNCCQIDTMCSNPGPHSDEWKRVTNSVYGQYKDVAKKVATACAGNNLLHYALTDMVLHYVMKLSKDCSVDADTSTDITDIEHAEKTGCEEALIVFTNGDNEYRPAFADRVMSRMQEDPMLDVVMINYMERGIQHVQVGTSGNSMDLGCMIFRVSSLKRLQVGFLTPLHRSVKVNAWPHHYYGADNVFLKYLHQQRGAKVGFLDKDTDPLFIHW